MDIILASGSPRRKDLLHQIGLDFNIIPAVGEEHITSTIPTDVVLELAEQKSTEVFQKMKTLKKDFCVIGADTIVAAGNQILGKPTSPENAKEILRMLQGQTHQVYTGVCVSWKREKNYNKICFYEKTEVQFFPMTEEEIETYVSTKDPMDKAGAYGIQGRCAAFIQGIHGDYNNVVGLPIGRLYQELKKIIY